MYRPRHRIFVLEIPPMSLPRVRLFEFSDSSWAPASLRDTIVESITRSLEWGHTMSGLVQPFEEFLAAAGTREVLELGAGMGGPSLALARAIRRAGRTPPRFILTDLRPSLSEWRAIVARHPEDISFEAEPVDATQIPPAIAGGRGRMVINALHHFPPEFARQLFADAVATGSGIFVAEPFERNPLRLLPLTLLALLSFVATPLLTQKARLHKALWILSTLGPLAALWDGVISTLRTYDEDELRAMVAPLGDSFQWTFGRHRYGVAGRGYYFYGVPRR
jgi:hypothetical protein